MTNRQSGNWDRFLGKFRVRRHSGTIAKVIRRTNSPVVHYTAKGLSPRAHNGDRT